jgi:hypothetical protein
VDLQRRGSAWQRAARTGALAALALAAQAPALAWAGGLVIGAGSPRAIGRAGTGTVGDDGGGALLVNPAALARRDGMRGQLGVAFSDDEIAWQVAADAPIARNQSPSAISPIGAAIGAAGAWVIAAGVMTSAIVERSLIQPRDRPSPGDLGNRFEFRYAGISGALRRRTAVVGAARRLGDSIAIGLAVSLARVSVSEQRRVWAGFSGRDAVGAPTRDVELALTGRDVAVPGAVAGLLWAPEGSALELGAAIGWSGDVELTTRDVLAVGTRDGAPDGTTARVEDPVARLALRQPWTVRAGARYLADHVVIEAGGDLWIAPAGSAQAAWRISGVRVVDPSTIDVPITRVPSRLSLRTHGAVRVSTDVELMRGFLWATAGYAYTLAAVESARQSPTFGDLGGHTAALGIEVSAGGLTLTAGWSRTWSITRSFGSVLRLDNPFMAGDGPVPRGTFDGSIDQVGIMIDAELDAP